MSLLYRLLLFLIALLASRIEQGPIAGIWSLEAGSCDLSYFSQPAQPVKTIVLLCPGVDAIRLWPWPPLQPWSEDQDQPGWPAREPAYQQAGLPRMKVGQK